MQFAQNTQQSQTIRTSYQSQRREKLEWLLANNLPPLPVAPAQDPYTYHKVIKANGNREEHCPLTTEFKPVPIFTGKNPSYLDEGGKPHLINHQAYQTRMPSNKEIKRWFTNPNNGIGTLGNDSVYWIDLDVKQFASQLECDPRSACRQANRAFNLLLLSQPILKQTLLEKTHSGGYRIGVKVKQSTKFTNFCLSPGGAHVGECLGAGRFTVLAPTIGASGNAYSEINCPERLVEIEQINFIYPTKEHTANREQKEVNSRPRQKPKCHPGTILLEELGHSDSRKILVGEDIKGDRSESLTTAIREWAGWSNWCHDKGIVITGSVEELAHYAGERLGIDSDRIVRILNSIEIDACHPAAYHRGGDESCWQKIRRLNKANYEAKCPEDIKTSLSSSGSQVKPMQSTSTSKSDRLKLEVQAYLQSPDIFDKVRIKGKICSFYRVNARDFNLLCQALEKQNSTPQATTFGFDDFINQGTDALEWVIPGILPKGETVLLAALAKTGKTLLATDIAYAVLSGDRVIGESPGVTGRVLLVSSDESANSTRRRLRARGFNLLAESSNLRVMTHLDISDLSSLEKELEDFRPQLVIIDSLTSITRESGISEKDAEFAKPIYKLKDLLSRYGAAGILIHHENKDKEAKGINKVSGSARIVAAVWGVWQMMATDPNNEKNPTRWLKVKPREGESTTLTLEINPKDLWASQGIFDFVGEFGDESGEKRTQGERVLELLRKFSPRGLEYQEIDRYLNVGKSLYTVLDRLEDRQLITKRRSKTDARRWVYCLPEYTTDEDNTTQKVDSISLDTPPPSYFSNDVELNAVNTTGREEEVIQQQFNINSTSIQQPQNVELIENDSTVDEAIDTESQEVIQHTTKDEGERVGVEQAKSVDILQNEQPIDLLTTQQDTSSRQTKSFDSTSGQEAFQQKYQPVEVFNSEGKWIGGYFVHKCLVVANLAGIERKYALYDESGSVYAFWGEIRLPRGKK